MKSLLRKELLICVLLLAACDSNDPSDDSGFVGTYFSKPNNVFADLQLTAGSQSDYEGLLSVGTAAAISLDCSGNETTLSCLENPEAFSATPYTLSKTSDGLDMIGNFEIEFERGSRNIE